MLTEYQEIYIDKHWREFSYKEISKNLNAKFEAVKYYIKSMGYIKHPKKMGERNPIPVNQKQEAFNELLALESLSYNGIMKDSVDRRIYLLRAIVNT